MEVMQPCRNPAVIPEVEGVQAFPPAFFYMAGGGGGHYGRHFSTPYITRLYVFYMSHYMSYFSLL